MSDNVMLKEIAQALNMERSHARKYIIKQGFHPVMLRTPNSGGQVCFSLTREDADAVIKLRRQQGYAQSQSVPLDASSGHFYVVQLVPDLDPNRLKLGFAVDVRDRLDSHRTTCPTAVVLKQWPCRRAWEIAAMASITRRGCRLIGSEVYQCTVLDAVIAQGNEFFAIMPSPDNRSSD